MSVQASQEGLGVNISDEDAELMRVKLQAYHQHKQLAETHARIRDVESSVVVIDYLNHALEQSVRTIIPVNLWFGETKWHPVKQWLLDAIDLDKKAMRTFAVKDIAAWTPTVPRAPYGAYGTEEYSDGAGFRPSDEMSKTQASVPSPVDGKR